MSQIFSYFKNLLNPHSIQERKRRRTGSGEQQEGLQHKYRRVTNIFPKKYNHRIDDDDFDHFQQVKQNRQHYNEILEHFVMDQQNHQRKQYREINDEEFSDEEDPARLANPSSHRFNQQPSSSGFQFKSKVGGPPPLLNFSHKNQCSDSRATFSSKPRQIPQLVPIARSVQNQGLVNGFSQNGHSFNRPTQNHNRRSVLNFTKKNRAFNDSPQFTFHKSVLDRTQNMECKNTYDSLLKMLIPRFSQKSLPQYSNNLQTKPNEAIDLSSDETETSTGATGVKPSNYVSFPSKNRDYRSRVEMRPSAFVDLSEDENSPHFNPESIFSSTLIRNKIDVSSPLSSRPPKSEPYISIPDVAPVNSLIDRIQARKCLQDDAIGQISKKYTDIQKKRDSLISEELKHLSILSTETAEQERFQQRRIDQTASILKTIVLDEEEKAADEYPPLTEQQLKVVRLGLHGSRGEIIASKFSLNITRQDLMTLDGLNWLNDEVINFYMELLRQRSEDNDDLPKVYAMNTFFIPKLLQMGHAGVRRWTRKVDIFSVDIIPAPVHVGGVHWCMSIINMREKTIRYYDSMGHPNHPVLDALKKYLQDESLDKRKIPFDTSDWKLECVRECPQQRNGSDCGVFSCMFAEFATRDSPISFDQQHMQYFRRKMVLEIASGRLLLGY